MRISVSSDLSNLIIKVCAYLFLPPLGWSILGNILGSKGSPTLPFTLGAMWGSVWFIALGRYLHQRLQTPNPRWAAAAQTLGIVLCIGCTAYAGADLYIGRNRSSTLSAWQSSVLAACTSFSRDALPPESDVHIQGKVWRMTNGAFSTDDGDQIASYTPPQRDAAVQVIAIINESYRDFGEYVSDDPMQSPTGVRAVQYIWTVSVCDLNSRRILVEKVFYGPEPAQKMAFDGSNKPKIYGVRPENDYQAWLAALTAR